MHGEGEKTFHFLNSRKENTSGAKLLATNRFNLNLTEVTTDSLNVSTLRASQSVAASFQGPRF